MVDRNTEALEALIARHWGEVFGCLKALTRRTEVAEELAQEVFLLAWRKNLRAGPELSAWFRRAARNLALNELTRKRPELWRTEALARFEACATAGTEAPSPFEDELYTLRGCLEELPEEDRRLLDARYAREVPLARVAEETGQSVGYLKQRLFRLRGKLAGSIRARLSGQETSRGAAGPHAARRTRPADLPVLRR